MVWVKGWVNAALLLGAPIVKVNAGWSGELGEETAFNYAVECIKEICEYAEDCGLMIAVENHGGITSTAEQVLRLIEAVDSDWFRVNSDTANFKQDLYESIEKLAPYTVHIHAKIFELKPKHVGVKSCWIETRLKS
jgi:sugar phosphate isomerase/epimerase